LKISNNNFEQKSIPIYKPELSTYLYYGNDELELIDFNIANKFIRTKVYIESLNCLNELFTS
jgi:hypothetical protein